MSLHQQLLDAAGPLVGTIAKDDVHHAFAARRALRAVVELHAPHPSDSHSKWSECHGCSEYAPCRTVLAIARELGIEAP